ncbi:hypothetical protein M1439_02055 [Candidatus Marsarchaeota archaeon]|jgi:hypothetical protein|nr:hypothetical protein [Candidatus Marsarchaeota archaeon]MCL5092099.1 hypothetical protein [Candidatus Marsarchaeota archaeon]
MELISKIAVFAILLIAIFGIAYVLSQHLNPSTLTANTVEGYVIKDLQQQNPNSSIKIINVTPSSIKSGSWDVVVRLISNGTRACPTLLIEGFDYPAMTLLPSLYNKYVGNCVISGSAYSSSYVVGNPAVAITEVYEQKNPAMMGYLSQYGYNNTQVNAKFYYLLNDSILPINASMHNAWVITYQAVNANYSLYAVLNQSGKISSVLSNNQVK